MCIIKYGFYVLNSSLYFLKPLHDLLLFVNKPCLQLSAVDKILKIFVFLKQYKTQCIYWAIKYTIMYTQQYEYVLWIYSYK